MIKEKKHSFVDNRFEVSQSRYQQPSYQPSYFDVDRLPGSGMEGGKYY